MFFCCGKISVFIGKKITVSSGNTSVSGSSGYSMYSGVLYCAMYCID